MKNQILVSKESMRIEYFYSDSNKDIAFIFSPSMNRSLEGNAFGGEYFFKNGFDTIAFKISNDDWFQSVPLDLFDTIKSIVNSKKYQRKIAYGSSMGGYASVAFSKLLECTHVIAFSPQYSINDTFDTRWLDYAKKIDFKYYISSQSINAICKFFFIYDNKNQDALHVEKITNLIPDANVKLLKLPFTGHPSIHYLYEVNLLKEVAIRIVNSGDVENINFFENKKKSKSYLKHLSDRLLEKNKFNLALSVINSAIQIDGVNPNYYYHRSKIFNNLGDLNEAVTSIEKAISLEPKNPHFFFHLSNLLYLKQSYDQAITVIEEALLFTQNSPHLFAHLSLLQREKGMLNEALSSINDALELNADMANLYNEKSHIYYLMGKKEEAIQLLKTAIDLDENNVSFKNRLNEFLNSPK